MINILFVDDEPNILEGLQRMLRPMRHEFEMSFAPSGAEALSILENKRIDVIVTDMKMPGMDGAQLLHVVAEKYPAIIRIILSGFSEMEMSIRSVGAAHQYLSKPCNPDMLKATVTRVCELRNLLTDVNLRRLVSQLPNVPSLPLLYSELIDELSKSEPSTRIVGEVIKKDIGMTVKILQIVNSAFFGLGRRISDSREAVEFLGLDTISSLTLGLGVISQFESHASGSLFTKIWAHSIAVGIMANKIAIAENAGIGDEAFTGGLLHDIGKVVLAANLPREFNNVPVVIQSQGISEDEAERVLFGATHSEVGAYLLGLWGLPSGVVEAVAFHHTPAHVGTDRFAAVTAVHAANAIQDFMSAEVPAAAGPDFDMQYFADLGLLDRLPVWQEKCGAFQSAAA